MTLTEAIFWTKKAGLGLLIAVLLFIPIRLIIYIIGLQAEANPEENLPYASQGYGTLPDVTLTGLSLAEGSSPTYQLETAEGEFPDLTPVAQVYKLPAKSQTLTALDEAKALADKLQFDSDPVRIGATSQYQWTDPYGRVLTYDLTNQNFKLKIDFEKDVYELKSIIPDLNTAENQAVSFLNSLKLYDESYKNGYVESTYLKFGTNGEYLIADSQSEAELIRIDFFRTAPLLQLTEEEKVLLEQYEEGDIELDPEEVPAEIIAYVKSQDINKSNISMVIRGTRFTKVGEIYELTYNYWPINETQTETYYVKDPAEAWEDLKNGKAYLTYLYSKQGEPYSDYVSLGVSQFLVYDISLIYLETPNYQSYLQPVYMIRGEARSSGNTGTPDLDFVYLTPAIKTY